MVQGDETTTVIQVGEVGNLLSAEGYGEKRMDFKERKVKFQYLVMDWGSGEGETRERMWSQECIPGFSGF